MTPEELKARIRPFLKPNASRRQLKQAAAITPKWFDVGAAHVGLRWDEWLSEPTLETIVAVLSGAGVPGALARLGSDRAHSGLTLPEASADFRALLQVSPRNVRRSLERSYADVAFSAGWWETFSNGLGPQSCIDPLSGLVTAEYLAVRMSELYRAGAALDYPPASTHALAVLHVMGANDSPLTRSRRRIEIGTLLRDSFAAGETIATNGDDAYVVLVPRHESLPEMLSILRERLSVLPSLRTGRVELWIEPLPADIELSHALVADLSRRG